MSIMVQAHAYSFAMYTFDFEQTNKYRLKCSIFEFWWKFSIEKPHESSTDRIERRYLKNFIQ